MARKKTRKGVNKKTKKLLKPRYQEGGEANLELLQGIGGLGSSAIDILDPQNASGVRSDAGSIGSGALRGATTGASIGGPLGAVAGGVIGGVTGLLGNKKAKREEQKAIDTAARLRRSLAESQSQSILANYDNKGTGLNSFRKGGRLGGTEIYTNVTPNPTKKIMNANTDGPYYISDASVFQNGGDFKPLSDQAVQVKADNPNNIDSVDAGFGLVDHNEVIDKKNQRVYSDSIKTRDGKRTIAQEAARLERMKSSNDRYKDSNDRIDQKLDELFNYQQMLNNNSSGEPSPGSPIQYVRDRERTRNQFGSDFSGRAKPYPSIDKQEMAKNRLFQANLYDSRRKKKKKFQEGGEVEPPVQTTTRQFVNQISKDAPQAGIFRDILDDIPDPLDQSKRITFGQLSDQLKDPNYRKRFESDHRLRQLMKQSGQTSTEDFLQGAFDAAHKRFFNKAAQPENRRRNIIDPSIQEKFRGMQDETTQAQQLQQATFGQRNPSLERLGEQSQLAGQRERQRYAEENPGGVFRPRGFQTGGNIPEGVPERLSPRGIDTSAVLAPSRLPALPNTPQHLGTRQNTGTLGNIADLAAQFTPNIANLAISQNLPQIPPPQLESSVNLQRISAGDQLAAIDQATRAGAQDIARNTAQSASAGAAKANLIAQGIGAKNRAIGDIQRTNVQIANQQAALNAQIGGRNVQRANQFQQQQLQRQLTGQQLRSQNLANAAEKYLKLKAQKNLKGRQKQELEILKKQFGESGVFDRNFQDIINNLNK